jgi:hypothetical protein
VKGTNSEGSRCNTPLWSISVVHNLNSAAVSKQPSRVKVIKWWCTPQWRYKWTLTRPLAGFPIGMHISFMSGNGILYSNQDDSAYTYLICICVCTYIYIYIYIYIYNYAVLGFFLLIFLVVFLSIFLLFFFTSYTAFHATICYWVGFLVTYASKRNTRPAFVCCFLLGEHYFH